MAICRSCTASLLSHMAYDLLARLPKCDHFSCFPHQMCQFPGRPLDILLHFCSDTPAYNWFIVGKLLRYWYCKQQLVATGGSAHLDQFYEYPAAQFQACWDPMTFHSLIGYRIWKSRDINIKMKNVWSIFHVNKQKELSRQRGHDFISHSLNITIIVMFLFA